MSEPVEPDKLFDPNGPDPATAHPPPARTKPDTTGFGTLLRVALGGAALAMDAIGSAVERQGESTSPAHQDQAEAEVNGAVDQEQEHVEAALRHILIGAAFEAGDQIDRRVSAATRRARQVASPAVGWARRSRLTGPARSRYSRIAARRAARLNRWQVRGMAEEMQGRALLGTVVNRSVDTSLERVVDSPQVQGLVDELIAAESVALSQRLSVEMRGRSVSADLYDAHLVRSVFRHPVPEIPPPPRAIPFPGDGRMPPASLRGRTAGFVTRLAALITDIVIISILIRAAGWFVEDVRLATGIQVYLPGLMDLVDVTTPMQLTMAGGLLISVVYLLFFWTMAGQTPGKALVGLRIVTRAGGRLSFWRALVRVLGYGLSSMFLGAGFWWAAIDDHREGWHDKLAGTSVVYSWDALPDEGFLAVRAGRTEEID